MPPVDTVSLSTAEEVRDYVAANPGSRIYVLAPETLERIQQAEDAGGFEGGMSGQFGTSEEGNPGPQSSDGSEPAPGEFLDLEGAWRAGAFFEGVVEMGLGIRDLVEAIREGATGPVILVPLKELKKLMGVGEPDEA